jgi:hypothetical protein
LNQVIEEFRHIVSAKTQQFSRYRKIQNQYYQNKMYIMDCKKFYNRIRQKNTNVPTKGIQNSWKQIFKKKFQHNEQAYWI